MKKVVLALSTLALTVSSALALPATVPAASKLYSQPSLKSTVSANVPAKSNITIDSCKGGARGWCTVTFQNQKGYMTRASVNAQGECQTLRAAGIGDIQRSEASYNRQRDPKNRGLACTKR